MSPQFSCDVFDISPDKLAKIDNLYIPDLPILPFAQKVTQNKKYSYHVTYHTTPKSLEQFLQCLEYKKEANSVQDMIVLVVDQRSKHLPLMPLFPEAYSSHHNKKHVQESKAK